jgi:hypothetical protein
MKERQRSANDDRIGTLIDADDEAAQASAIASIVRDVTPIMHGVLAHVRTSAIESDAEDIIATVHLRLVRRLQLARIYEDEAIRRLDEFVATLTYNTAYDVLRRRFPERARLKSRLRYLFTHDDRFALWQGDAGLTCGTSRLRGAHPAPRVVITKDNASRAMLRRDAPADALLAVFAKIGQPLPFEDLIDLAAELWDISDVAAPEPANVESSDSSAVAQIEARQYLTNLWREIRELRPPQRAALLLNLRDDDGRNALVHFCAANITTVDEIADALEMSREQLAAMWDDLPVGDAAIANILGLTRQQVINLRKSARERLARRMK